MKAIVVGNGGREHALAWSLLRSPNISRVFCIPGNGGTATLANCQNVAMSATDFDGISRFALVQGAGLVVVGPEAPLAAGLVDRLKAEGIAAFGPTKDGAQIEASKAWAKSLMAEAGVPTAASAAFGTDEKDAAIAYVRQNGAPIVVKADGLAAGKGVVVAQSEGEAIDAIEAILGGRFGEAGATIVIEEFLTGQEVSVLAIADGKTVVPLLPAQDHKQVGEGDTGPNTGGMGVYAPTPLLSSEQVDRVRREVLEPTLAALRSRDIDFRGVLYAGLMVAEDGTPKVLEFNCRFGDPETQAVLPLLETPLDEVLLACVEGRLAELDALEWSEGVSVCVVLASGGYPEAYEKGKVISGIEIAETQDAVVFHAGTTLQQGQLLTSGGRVLGVTTVAEDFEAAIAKTYAAVEPIEFEGCYYRRDIGYRIR
ncbi:MAG: phosphoribosylamine--glycine ligase [Geitlerinemataceae cyanobacterium]